MITDIFLNQLIQFYSNKRQIFTS